MILPDGVDTLSHIRFRTVFKVALMLYFVLLCPVGISTLCSLLVLVN